MANVEAGNDKQLIIKELVESYSLTISSVPCPNSIRAISTLENIYGQYGYHVLDRILRLIAGTWEGENHSFSANMLNGVAKLIHAYGDDIKDDVFQSKLCHVSIKELSRAANDRRHGSLGFAEAMLIYYNKKNHGGLPWEKLYVRDT